jgi:flagellin
MAQVINTNIASLNAQRNLNSSQAGTNEALQRLSSGLRINSAKDDAAGLAISTRFTSQINGLNVAVRNANDGISLAETAEASMGSMTDSLQRLRELAVQSANGSYSDADRQLLNEEAKALIAEVGRVADSANFNGVKLLDGTYNSSFQVGANAGETIDVSIGKLSADTLGVSAQNGVSATGTSVKLSAGDLILNGVAVGASVGSDDEATGSASSAISKAAAINRVSDQSGVTAVVDTNVAAGSSMTGADATGTVTINGTTVSIDTSSDEAATRASVVAAINAKSGETGVVAVDSGDDALGVTLEAADGRNIKLSFGGALNQANTGLGEAKTYEGGYTLVANAGVNSIEVSGSGVENAGLISGDYTAGVSSVSSTSQNASNEVTSVTFAAVTGDGTTVFDGVTVNMTIADQGTAALAAEKFVADYNAAGTGNFTAVVDSANPANVILTSKEAGNIDDLVPGDFTGTATGGGVAATIASKADGTAAVTLSSGDMVINGVNISAARASDDTASFAGKEGSAIAIAAAINKSSDSTGVTATANSNVIAGSTTTDPSAAGAGASATLTLNGVDISLTTSASGEETRSTALDAINAVSGQTGVVAEDNGEGLTLTAADGRNISIAFAGEASVVAEDFGLNNDAVNKVNYSTVSLSSGGQFTVSGGTGGTAALEALGFETGTFGGAETGQRLTEVDLSTQKGATDALRTIDNALGSITQSRSELGAVQNRFTATIENLSATSEKFSAANSRIQDADFAAEAANLARSQALQQAGVSMLAQANAQSQQVLQLLG